MVGVLALTELRSLRPPAKLIDQSGPGDWQAIGDNWAQRFVDWGGLTASDAVLEVGCGVGRVALGLYDVLGEAGRYEGVDVHRGALRWCRTAIEPRWPIAHFQHINVRNRAYNRFGRIRPTEVRLPFPDGSFDLVVATSVFTHMLLPEVRHYLTEMRRVVRPGGRCLTTFFVLGDGSPPSTPSEWGIPFAPLTEDGQTWALKPSKPEAAVAFDLAAVSAAIADAGLRVDPPVHWGDWRAPTGSLDYQDTVVCRPAAVAGGPAPVQG